MHSILQQEGQEGQAKREQKHLTYVVKSNSSCPKPPRDLLSALLHYVDTCWNKVDKRQLLAPDDFNTTLDLCEVQDLSWTWEPDLTALKCIYSLVMAAAADEFVQMSFTKVNQFSQSIASRPCALLFPFTSRCNYFISARIKQFRIMCSYLMLSLLLKITAPHKAVTFTINMKSLYHVWNKCLSGSRTNGVWMKCVKLQQHRWWLWQLMHELTGNN